MKIFISLAVVLSVLAIAPIQGSHNGEEEAGVRVKKHSGYYSGRPTYGGYQNVGTYQQPQPYYSNQQGYDSSTDSDFGGYQRPNFNQGLENMRYYYYQQPGQNFYNQPSVPDYQEYNGYTPHHHQYDY